MDDYGIKTEGNALELFLNVSDMSNTYEFGFFSGQSLV